ncbi:4Fe-4S binding protein [bacterium]|nr:4Fe-4S binding protein [bacterium]
MALSVVSRACVLLLLCTIAFWTEYSNLKLGYGNARLVELSDGKAMRIFYEWSDTFFSWFGDPAEVARTFGGMTWSIRILGVPFTDPIAALSLLVRDHAWTVSIAAGLLIPLLLAVLFGRVFCAWICPASLLFFAISRVRRILGKVLYFPDKTASRGLAWGVLAGGLITAAVYGHGVWILILPYFAMGQTLFHSIAFGTLSVAIGSLVVFSLADLGLGRQFSCRYLCPTGRLLGVIGRKAVFSIRRDASRCRDSCHSCTIVCPLSVDPKRDQTVDCSLCGECAAVCPTQCLSFGRARKGAAA